MIITTSHARDSGFCVSGIKKYFEQHGLDYRQFIKHGLDEETIASTNTEFSRRIIETAHKE